MTHLEHAAVCGALRTFLCEQVVAPDVQLLDGGALTDAGVDSFALMEVVLFVERRFGVVLPMEELTPDNVRTIETLARMVVEVTGAR